LYFLLDIVGLFVGQAAVVLIYPQRIRNAGCNRGGEKNESWGRGGERERERERERKRREERQI
jgi:hypothetical protein